MKAEDYAFPFTGEHLMPMDDQGTTTRFKIQGMDCPDCVEKVEGHLQRLDGVHEVRANLMTRSVSIIHRADAPAQQDIKEAIEEIGYTVGPEGQSLVLAVPDMDSPDKANEVQRAIQNLDGIVKCSTSSMNHRATVIYDPSATDEMRITSAVRRSGYDVKTERRTGISFWKDRKKVLTVLSGTLFFTALTLKFIAPEARLVPIGLWQDLLFLMSALLGGLNFFPAGIRALRTLSLDMHFLMTAAIFGAACLGEYTEAAAIAFLFSTAELLEGYSIDRARNSITSLMDLAPDTAAVVRNGQECVVPVAELEHNERVFVRPGEKIPIDGTVVGGTSAVDQSPITGESMPITKNMGDEVFAGTINCEGFLALLATRTASESTLSRIIRMVEEAEENRSSSEQFVRKLSRIYTPVVTLLAVGVILIPPLILGAEFDTWFLRGLTLLVIACPCALVISTPVAVISGITSAARNGVLIKGGNHLEALAEVRVVAFDKTGTLTHGKLEVSEIFSLNGLPESEVLRLAGALEQRSQHPIARAIVKRAEGVEFPEVSDFESITGRGARARINGGVLTVGKPELFPGRVPSKLERFYQEGKTVVLIGNESELIGGLAVVDTVRKDARESIQAMHRLGVERIVMLTGDNALTARTIARELEVDEFRAGLLPEQKVEAVRELEQTYGRVAMIGDGINDAPALAAASVGIAMGAAGTDAALENADVALMADDLTKLPYLLRLSRISRRVIRQNVWSSILIKFVLAVGVFPGLVSLVTAILLGDMGTSLGVTGNALRLAKVRAAQN